MGGPGRDLPSAKYRLCALDVGGPLSLLAEGNPPLPALLSSRPTRPPPSLLYPARRSHKLSLVLVPRRRRSARAMATEIFILML